MNATQRVCGRFGRWGASFKAAVASAFLAGTILLSAPLTDAEAAPGDRALNVLNVHTNQQATVVYKRGGRYDSAGLKQLNYLLRDWRKNEPTNMDPKLFDLIWEVYKQSGSRQPIHVVCGYRSPATNGMLRARSRGVAKQSQHMLGKAMDFYFPDVPLPKLRAIGLRMQVGGVGFYPTSGSPFVHMDTGSVRHWPKMTRDQLVRVFPDGKTLHVPSDGRPLPGYEQALAAYKARKAGGGAIMMASADDAPATKGKSWLAKLVGGGADEEEDTANDAAITKGRTAVAAAEPAPAEAAPEPKPFAEAAEPETVVAMADVPLPRPSPIERAVDAPVAEAPVEATMVVADADLPPIPRASPVARPMVAMASAAGDTPKSAADAIADAIGTRNDNQAPLMAYAPENAAAPHIDASSGALVAGRATAKRPSRTVRADDTKLVPVGYRVETIELVMRSGSTRQMDYAQLAMPQPFDLPEFFAAAESSSRATFGRVAYNATLRTDRSASLGSSSQPNLKLASN